MKRLKIRIIDIHSRDAYSNDPTGRKAVIGTIGWLDRPSKRIIGGRVYYGGEFTADKRCKRFYEYRGLWSTHFYAVEVKILKEVTIK